MIWLAAALWVLCGVAGAIIQRQHWRRHRMPLADLTKGLDFVINGLLGPLALVGCLIAYRD